MSQAREVCFLIGPDQALLWADLGPGPLALPDSRARWEALWRHREALVEVAHSHPLGPATFSEEDRTTMQALAAALPRTPRFSVLSPAGLLVREPDGREAQAPDEPWWCALLRAASGMPAADSPPQGSRPG